MDQQDKGNQALWGGRFEASPEAFTQAFGLDFERMYSDLLKAYIEGGFMRKTETGYAFTVKGMYVSNYILSSMLDFDSEIDRNIANGTDH